jgi:hypothetical protein
VIVPVNSSLVITGTLSGRKVDEQKTKKLCISRAFLMAREDSNLHPVKPGQGPQPCHACDQIVHTLNMQGFCPRALTIWTHWAMRLLSRLLSRRPNDATFR